jgi:hypothetical protein
VSEHDYLRKRELFRALSLIAVESARSAEAHQQLRGQWQRWDFALGFPGNVAGVLLAGGAFVGAVTGSKTTAAVLALAAGVVTIVRELLRPGERARQHEESAGDYARLRSDAIFVRDTRIRHYTATPLDELVYTVDAVHARFSGLEASTPVLVREPGEAPREHPDWREPDF